MHMTMTCTDRHTHKETKTETEQGGHRITTKQNERHTDRNTYIDSHIIIEIHGPTNIKTHDAIINRV